MKLQTKISLKQVLRECWIFVLLTLLVLFFVRLIFIFQFVGLRELGNNLQFLPLMLLNVFRYDYQVAAFGVAPLFVFALTEFFGNEKISNFRSKFSFWYTFVVLLLLSLLCVCDIQFYNNFHQHYNVVTFDLFDENPKVLIKGILDEAPLLLIFLFALCCGAFLYYSLRFFYKKNTNVKQRGVWWMLIATILLWVIGARGSLGVFTLRAEDMYVSPSAEINNSVPNAFFMLIKASKEKKSQFKIKTETEILNEYGFSTFDDALVAYCGSAENKDLNKILFSKTSQSPVAQNYNVVFVLTESWSNRLIDYEQYGLNLLGEFRQHYNDDIVFRNFLSAKNGTIDAVECLTVNSVFPRLFTSKYRNIEYKTSNAKIFHDAGYETSFVSGIEISWRNLMEVLPLQKFDNVIGKFEILKENPSAECNHTWGVYDHEMLRFVLQKLQKSEKPQFFFCLTSTSHTPFQFPDNYVLPELNLDKVDGSAFAVDKDIAYNYVRGFQYETQALGEFLTALKKTKFAENTIVVITGDHNIRSILPYEGVDEKWRYSVPLYVYLPENVRSKVNVEKERCGSHLDIFPTLANLTIADGEYYNSGQNLFADSLPSGSVGTNDEYTIFSENADTAKLQRQEQARKALQSIYFSRIFTEKRK